MWTVFIAPDDKLHRPQNNGMQGGIRCPISLSSGASAGSMAGFTLPPVVLQIEHESSLIVRVGADVCRSMSWADFTRDISLDDAHLIAETLWSRRLMSRGQAAHVDGLAALFVGHTVVL